MREKCEKVPAKQHVQELMQKNKEQKISAKQHVQI
jgi:hypothetical protein